MGKVTLPEFRVTLPNGLELDFHPTSETRHNTHDYGPFEFYLVAQEKVEDSEDYLVSRLKIQYAAHGNGENRKRYLVVTVIDGEPLTVAHHSFKGPRESFYPENGRYTINGLNSDQPTIVIPGLSLSSLRLDFARVKPPGELY